jgi:hypothetical protein
VRIILDTDVASNLIKNTLPGGSDVGRKWGEITAFAQRRGRRSSQTRRGRDMDRLTRCPP